MYDNNHDRELVVETGSTSYPTTRDTEWTDVARWTTHRSESEEAGR